MTGVRLLLWVLVSVLSTSALFGVSFAAFALGRGDWLAFFHSPARVGALVVSLAGSALVAFSGFGWKVNSGRNTLRTAAAPGGWCRGSTDTRAETCRGAGRG
jgi:hypothetical protein